MNDTPIWKRRPSVLLCDLGDTLLRWTGYSRRDGLRAMVGLCDVSERFDMETLVERGERLDADLEKRAQASLVEFRQADFLRTLFGTLGMQLLCDDDHLEWLYWRSAFTFEPEPGVADALGRIAECGVTLGIISNTIFGPESLAGELERNEMARRFARPILTSARFGLRKPHPAIFESALGLFDTTREEAWYVGNSVYHDVGGANAARLPVVWYNEDGQDPASEAQNGERPDMIVASWTELADTIEALPERRGNLVV